MVIAYGLGRGDMKWSSESSGVIVASGESCGDMDNRIEANSERLLVGAACWVWGTPAEPAPNPGLDNMLLSPMPCYL